MQKVLKLQVHDPLTAKDPQIGLQMIFNDKWAWMWTAIDPAENRVQHLVCTSGQGFSFKLKQKQSSGWAVINPYTAVSTKVVPQNWYYG